MEDVGYVDLQNGEKVKKGDCGVLEKVKKR